MRPLLCALLALPCAGCLYHRADVDGDGADREAGRTAAGTRVHDGAPDEFRTSPLPLEIPVTWTLREDGRLLMAAEVVRTPLPWWQRFPIDLAVDLWPARVEVVASATLVPHPVTPRSADDITAEARAHGYAQ